MGEMAIPICAQSIMQNLLPAFFKTIDVVCADWDERSSSRYGFKIEASKKSIARAHFFVDDLLTENPALPADPGPFKITAAFLVSAMHFIKFRFITDDGSEMSEAQKTLWKSRILFKAISVFLLQLKLTASGKTLIKIWDAPTIHYRLDFLNFIRWCEFPLDGPANPPPPNKPTVDVVRINRLIMALTLIIEACYYLAENDIKCDVKGKVHINPDEIDPSVRPDLDFDC